MYATDNTNFVNAFGLAFALTMGLLILVLPRRHALIPVFALVCYMTMGQRVLILGLNFTMIRILLLFAFARVVLEEGIALRAGDIDIVYVNGYGFPAWRGGPMWYSASKSIEKPVEKI